MGAPQPIYDQLTKAQPDSADGWRGLILAYARDNKNDQALAVQGRIPASVKAALNKDPEYLRILATIYQAEDRPADAQRVLAEALASPFPNNGTTLKAEKARTCRHADAGQTPTTRPRPFIRSWSATIPATFLPGSAC